MADATLNSMVLVGMLLDILHMMLFLVGICSFFYVFVNLSNFLICIQVFYGNNYNHVSFLIACMDYTTHAHSTYKKVHKHIQANLFYYIYMHVYVVYSFILFIFSLFSLNIEHEKWESQIDAWQRPILQDKRFPEW